MIEIYMKDGKENRPICAMWDINEENIDIVCSSLKSILLGKIAGKQIDAVKAFAEILNKAMVSRNMTIEFKGARYYLVDEAFADEVIKRYVGEGNDEK